MSGKALVVASTKGGAGKTTMIVCLAVHWLLNGRTVALLDVDPNQTLSRWHSKGMALSGATLRTTSDEIEIVGEMTELVESHDIVLVDCPGFGNQSMVFAIGGADLVLIPSMADEASVFEALRVRKLVDSAAVLTKREISARTVLSRVKRAAIVDHTWNQLTELGTHPLDSRLGDRTVFQESSYHGASPVELAPKSSASAEIGALAKEIEPLIF
ncbi:MAG: ParA family protein [Proteobacteria bacterium]|nr:ParA family protein [Pseudomonadota bacterium]